MQANDSGKIVLFESSQAGTVVERGKQTDSIQILGYYSNTWIKATDKGNWTPFIGVIELSN